jgi:bifunctional polynucleotide phosphatase/kinase
MEWNLDNPYIYGKYKDNKLNIGKIAGFDLDSTIIKSTSNKKFTDDPDEWMLFNDNVIDIFNFLHNDGFKIVIITNQKGIGLNKVDIQKWQQKINNIALKINIPFHIYASKFDDKWRKPLPTFWTMHQNTMPKHSFYCGDAAGRPGDFSDSDYKFAINSNTNFILPEDLFIKLDDINKAFIFYNEPVQYPVNFNTIKNNYKFKPEQNEMILMSGFPGSGKSTFTKNNILTSNIKYQLINMDTLKTAVKCLKICETSLKNNINVVIDNTNPNKSTRLKYTELAKKYNFKCRCLIMNTTKDHSMHNNYYRAFLSDKKPVPRIAYAVYSKKYEEPELNEGFDIIEKIDFNIDTSNDKYKMYFF